MSRYSLSTFLAVYLGEEALPLPKPEILNRLLKPLCDASRLHNQFGRPFRVDAPTYSRLRSGASNLPRKISLAAVRSLKGKEHGSNAYGLFLSLRPFVEPSSVAEELMRAIGKSPLVPVNEKNALMEASSKDLPSFFERAFLLSLVYENRAESQRTRRKRGRPAKVDAHPDYANLSTGGRSKRAALFLPRLQRKKGSLSIEDFEEFFEILRYEAFPFGPRSRERVLSVLLSSFPKKTAIEPVLAFGLRFKKEIASFSSSASEKATLFLPLIEPLGAELKVQELLELRDKALASGHEEPFLEAYEKTLSAFYWRKSSPTFRSLLKLRQGLIDPRLSLETRKALEGRYASFEG